LGTKTKGCSYVSVWAVFYFKKTHYKECVSSNFNDAIKAFFFDFISNSNCSSKIKSLNVPI